MLVDQPLSQGQRLFAGGDLAGHLRLAHCLQHVAQQPTLMRTNRQQVKPVD